MKKIYHCSECKFFDSDIFHASGAGTCRRYAPRGPVITQQGDNIAFFPLMLPNMWCGEFELKLVLEN